MTNKEANELIAKKIMGYDELPINFNPMRNISDAWSVLEKITVPTNKTGPKGLPINTEFAYLFQGNHIWTNDKQDAAVNICTMALMVSGLIPYRGALTEFSDA